MGLGHNASLLSVLLCTLYGICQAIIYHLLSGIGGSYGYIIIMKEMSILVKVGRRIRELRKIKNMSQEALAEKADLHPSLIGKMERGEINPTIVSLDKIARAFDISVAELLSFPENKKIIDADVSVLDKSINILNQIIEIARSYKSDKINT